MRELNVNEIEQVEGGGGASWILEALIYDAGKWLLSHDDWGTASYEAMMIAP